MSRFLIPGRGARPGKGGNVPTRKRFWHDTTPRVYSINPNADRIAGGTAFTIVGSEFRYPGDGTPPTVLIGGVPATSVVVVDRYTITGITPADLTTGIVDVSVTNDQGQTGTLEDGFTYYDSIILSVEPNRGTIAGGTTVVIEGVNFQTGQAVTFDGVAATDVEFIDSQHYSAVTPAHATGPVTVAVGTKTLPGAFYYTLLVAGEDIRRQPGIHIHEILNNTPNNCTFLVDGSSAPPKTGSEVSIMDGATKLFGGVAVRVRENYEDQTTQLVWSVEALDYVYWLNRLRPIGNYVCVSITNIVKDLITRYAPWVTVNHVQANLPPVSIFFSGVEDFSTCLSRLAKMMGAGQWKLDYTKDLHFFHKRLTGLTSASGMSFAIPDIRFPETSVGASIGTATAPDVAFGDPIQSFSRGPAWTSFFVTFVYNNGIESAPGLLSAPKECVGNKKINFSNIPIGPAIGSLTCVKRNIYAVYIRSGPGLAPFPIDVVNNNTDTSFTSRFQGRIIGGGSSFKARLPTVAPPAAPTSSPDIDESSQSIGSARYDRVRDGYQNLPGTTFQLGMSGSYTPGIYRFRFTNLYGNGSESLPSPESSSITLPGASANWGPGKTTTFNDYTAITGRCAASEDLDGVPVIARKVYYTYLGYHSETREGWTAANSSGFDLIPNNDEDRHTLIVGSLGSGSQSGAGTPPATKKVIQCEVTNNEGPDLESSTGPAEINDLNMDLLRDTPVTTEVNITQLRNRVTVYGGGVSTTKAALKGDTVLYVSTTDQQHPTAGRLVAPTLGIVIEQEALTTIASGDTLMIITDGLPIDVPIGTVFRGMVTLNDVAAQKFIGAIELDADGNPTDGVHEVIIDDPSLATMQQIIARAQAELELFAWPIVEVNYSTRDNKTGPGKTVPWNLTNPPIRGTFLIQEVDIDQINEDADSPILTPRYTARASSMRFDLDDLLILLTENKVPTVPTMDGITQLTTGGILQVEATVSIAGLQANDAVIVSLVPAYGEGTVIVPTSIATNKDNTFPGGSAYGTGGSAALRWRGFAGFNMGTVGLDMNNIRITQNVTAVNAISTTVDAGNNSDLVLVWTSAPNSSGNAILKVTVSYMVLGAGAPAPAA